MSYRSSPVTFASILAALLLSPGLKAADEAATTLETVVISASADASAEGLTEAYAGGQVAQGGRVGLLGSKDNMDTPFNITSYTQQLIQNQQAASVGEVLLNDPAVRNARGFGNFQQLYMVRGLPIFSDDMSYNGLYGLLPRQYLAAELVERVEVLRGASAFLNGAAPGGSGLGGAVNIMPKRAPNDPLTQVTAGLQTGEETYLATDVARRFADGRVGVRFNGVSRDGDTAVDGESRELGMAAVGADYRGDALRISADLGYQDQQLDATQPSITIAAGLAIPNAPDASESIAQPWTYSNERDVFGTLRAEYDFNDVITGWVAGGSREGDERSSLANPTVINAAGDSGSYRFDAAHQDSVITGEMGLRMQFHTGDIGHRVTTSTSTYENESSNAYAYSNFFTPFIVNIYNPVAVAAPLANFGSGGSLSHPKATQQTETSSFAVADELAFLNETLLVTLGARHQTIEDRSYDYNSGAKLSDYSEDRITPVAGVVYKFTPELSAYMNYIEGLVKGDVAPATNTNGPVANAGEALEPYQTEQTEAGIKFDAGRLGSTVSVYQSRKPIAGYDGNNRLEEVDDQVNKGLEVSVYGEATPDVTVLGGVSFLDTDVDGEKAIGAPDTQANLGIEWSVPQLRGLVLDGRTLYTSSQYADAANDQKVPSWTRLDLGARYLMELSNAQIMTLRARVDNVTGRDYWASAGGYPGAGYLTVGTPRTFIMSASVDF